jgi:hypothetical protein
MSAVVGHFTDKMSVLGAKGPMGNSAEGGKKLGRGAVSKSLGTPMTKARRPGGR